MINENTKSHVALILVIIFFLMITIHNTAAYAQFETSNTDTAGQFEVSTDDAAGNFETTDSDITQSLPDSPISLAGVVGYYDRKYNESS